jgi:hypothetical protein
MRDFWDADAGRREYDRRTHQRVHHQKKSRTGCPETGVQEQTQCSKEGPQGRKNTLVGTPQLGRAAGRPGKGIKIYFHMWKSSGTDNCVLYK